MGGRDSAGGSRSMSRERIARRLGAVSILTVLSAAGLLMAGVSFAGAAVNVSLYQRIDTGLGGSPQWNPTAPGPSGVAYNKDNDTMFVVDTDANNYSWFGPAHVALWEISKSGTIMDAKEIPTWEPTGVDYDPEGNRLFITTDARLYGANTGTKNWVIVIDIGPDGHFGTADDGATHTYNVENWGSGDTEDPAYDKGSDQLFFLSGDEQELYRMNPSTGAQIGSVISLSDYGTNFEGLAITPDGYLLLGSENGSAITMLTLSGGFVQTINVNSIGQKRISGLGVSVPGVGGASYDIWMADRNETGFEATDTRNDGRVWHLSTNGTPPPPSSTTTTTTATTTTTQPPTTTTTTQPPTTTTTTQPPTTTTTTTPGSSTTTTTTPGSTTTTTLPPPPIPGADPAVVHDESTGQWKYFYSNGTTKVIYFGNPGDVGFMGDWNCDGVDTPGLYRQSDGYVYLRNSNTQGIADISFFFGNPGDVPVAGDTNGNGCDTVSIYRPSEGKFYIVNKLGSADKGLGVADFSFYYGVPGDQAFLGDFNGDGVDTPGLRRDATGFVYLRNSNSAGFANLSYFYGINGDIVFTGDWDGDGDDTLGLYRPSNQTVYLRNTNSTGIADLSYHG
jgi:hypothetical protein